MVFPFPIFSPFSFYLIDFIIFLLFGFKIITDFEDFSICFFSDSIKNFALTNLGNATLIEMIFEYSAIETERSLKYFQFKREIFEGLRLCDFKLIMIIGNVILRF